MDQGSFFGVRICFLASEGGSLHKYTNQSQFLHILQPEKRTPIWTEISQVRKIGGICILFIYFLTQINHPFINSLRRRTTRRPENAGEKGNQKTTMATEEK
jgi:hypothetical protein